MIQFQKMEKEFPEVEFKLFDIDKIGSEILNKYDINNVPILILLRDNVEEKRIIGIPLIAGLRKVFKDFVKGSDI
jgi:hypothetical protein